MTDLDQLDPHLESRVRASLARRADLATHVVTPPSFHPMTSDVVVAERPPWRHRRRSMLLAAASVLLVVAAIAALTRPPSRHDVEVTPQTTAPKPEPDVAFVADWYPEGVEPYLGDATFTDPSDGLDQYRDYHLLGRDRPQVTVWSTSSPLSNFPGAIDPDTMSTSDTTVDGRTARVDTVGDVHSLAIALRPGLTLTLAGRVDPATLEQLSAAFADPTARFHPDRLPSGWSEFDDPGRLLLGAQWPGMLIRFGSFYAASSPSADDAGGATNRNVSVVWTATDDPAKLLDRYVDVWGAQRVDVGGRAGVVQKTADSPGRSGATTLVMAFDDHHVGWLTSMGLPQADLVRIGASLRRAEPGEWPTPAPAPITTDYEGMTLSGPSPQVLASGEIDGMPWAIATDESGNTPASTPAPLRPHQLVFLHPDGKTSSMWLGGANTIMGPTLSRDPRLLVVVAFAPLDVTDVGMRVDGVSLDVSVAPLAGRDVQLVMAVLPAIDHDDSMQMSSAGIQVVGTRPDGSSYANEPLSGAGMSFAVGAVTGEGDATGE